VVTRFGGSSQVSRTLASVSVCSPTPKRAGRATSESFRACGARSGSRIGPTPVTSRCRESAGTRSCALKAPRDSASSSSFARRSRGVCAISPLLAHCAAWYEGTSDGERRLPTVAPHHREEASSIGSLAWSAAALAGRRAGRGLRSCRDAGEASTDIRDPVPCSARRQPTLMYKTSYVRGTIKLYHLKEWMTHDHQRQRGPLAPVPPYPAGQRRPRPRAYHLPERRRRADVSRGLRLLAGDYLPAAFPSQRPAPYGGHRPGQGKRPSRYEDHATPGSPGCRGVRSVHFDPDAWEDFVFWLSADRRMARRITRLIGEIQRDPFAGIGKPDPLKGALSGHS